MRLRLRSRRAAFTLVELLVVIAVIALLMAILIPTLTQVTRSARRVTCSNNLREITRAMVAYASAGNLHRGTVANALPSVGPTTGNWGDMKEGNPGAYWLMLTGRQPDDTPLDNVRNAWLQPGVLVCPSAERSGKRAPEISDAGMTVETYSYSYLSQVPFTEGGRTYTATSISGTAGSLAILADRNPACEPGEESFEAGLADQNSPNHGQTGQNVASLDQSVQWLETPELSGGDSDNIYAPEPGGDAGSGQRAGVEDSFLIP
ncbi:MAG: type II secretion system protein [Phycisphaerae bacterium]